MSIIDTFHSMMLAWPLTKIVETLREYNVNTRSKGQTLRPTVWTA